ncbi:hypothetical protein Tco_0905515 [Tanacetum coccineum]
MLHAREDLMESIQNFLKKLIVFPFREGHWKFNASWDKFFEVKHAQSEENFPTSSYDDDDDEYSFATQEYFMTWSTAITPDLPITDSLIMEDEHLDTIPETESDEENESSVKDLNLTLSDHLITFSNPLFDIDDNCTSSDDESFSEEDVPMENFKFFSNPLFDLDEEIISTDVNLIQNEVLESITLIPPGIDSFDAESNLIESLRNQNTSIDSSSKIDSLLE